MAPEFSGKFDPIELSAANLSCEGVRQMTIFSPALHSRGDISVFVPRNVEFHTELPLVILLHGVYGSHWNWFGKGGAHRTAQALIDSGVIRPMLIATPSDGLQGDGSGYWPRPQCNSERWIAHDVPMSVRSAFPSHGPLFLAGLSMGGYGALRIAFKYTNLFSGISAHSSITAAEQMYDFVRDGDLKFEDMAPGETEILFWASTNRAQLPAIRFDCGRDDPLFAANIQFSRALQELGTSHIFESFEGSHDWAYWSAHLADTLRFFEACRT
jgi:S-formylglutathione hydrolase FrmB